MIIHLFTYLLFFFFLLIFCIDLIPILRDWLLRIKIGKYDNLNIWRQAVLEKTSDWLIKTPKIKVTDNSRLIILDMLRGDYTNSNIQHWQEGSLLLGLTEYLKSNHDPTLIKNIEKYLESTFDHEGQWIYKPKNIDVAILAYAILKLDIIEVSKYKKAFDYVWELIKEHIGEDGTVLYRRSMKPYRYVDTIGFICPFLISYGLKYKKIDCIDLALSQIRNYENYGIHKELNIPVHAFHIGNKMPLGLYGWGRGLGWYAIGVIDSWNELPGNHKYKKELEKIVIKFAEAVMKSQQSDGSWTWTVNRNECTKDSSTTATLSWYLVNAGKIDEISEQCNQSSEKALKYLMSVTRKTGAVDFSQGDTKDIGVYSNLFNILPFTQGFSLRTVTSYIDRNKTKYSKVS